MGWITLDLDTQECKTMINTKEYEDIRNERERRRALLEYSLQKSHVHNLSKKELNEIKEALNEERDKRPPVGEDGYQKWQVEYSEAREDYQEKKADIEEDESEQMDDIEQETTDLETWFDELQTEIETILEVIRGQLESVKETKGTDMQITKLNLGK